MVFLQGYLSKGGFSGHFLGFEIAKRLEEDFSSFLHSFLCFFLVVLDLHCCEQVLSSCRKGGLLSGVQASRCGGFSCCRAWALEHVGFSTCGTGTQLLHGMWNLPGQGIEPVSPTLAGGYLITGLLGKIQRFTFQRDKEGIYKFSKVNASYSLSSTMGRACHFPSLPHASHLSFLMSNLCDGTDIVD